MTEVMALLAVGWFACWVCGRFLRAWQDVERICRDFDVELAAHRSADGVDDELIDLSTK